MKRMIFCLMAMMGGENAHPLYTWLKAQAGGGDIKWNFTKFLVSRDGKVIKRYETRDQIATIEADIIELVRLGSHSELFK